MELEEMQSLIPAGLSDKIDILFGNLDEIYAFHADIFLKDLENCITSVDLVALCFVQRVGNDNVFHLKFFYRIVFLKFFCSEICFITCTATTVKIFPDLNSYGSL